MFLTLSSVLTQVINGDTVSSSDHNDDDPESSFPPETTEAPSDECSSESVQKSETNTSHCYKCALPLPDPQSISCCGTKFCSACISEIKEGGESCPCCGELEFEFVSAEELQLVIQKKSFTCPYCNDFTSSYEDVVTNHWPTCPHSFPVVCPKQCGQLIQRHDLDSHIENDCPNAIVDCTYKSSVGCEERLPRERMFYHLLTHIEPLELREAVSKSHRYVSKVKEVRKVTVLSKKAGYECDFVLEVTDAFQTRCPVCLQILREPYATDCCGKSFCSFCIQQIKMNGKPCPLCNSAKYDLHPNMGLKQSLYQLSVYCTNKSGGCEWKGELGELDKHINSGPSDSPSVQLSGCHLAEIDCFYCSEEFQRCNLEEHQSKHCPRRLITCPLNCGKELPYDSLEEHIRSDCKASTSNFTQTAVVCADDVFRWISSGEFKDHETLLLLTCSMDSQTWNCDEKNSCGDTALHLACVADRNEIVEFLLTKMKSNPNVQNDRQETPIQLTNQLSIISQLIQHGAVFTSEDVKKWMKQFSPLEVAKVITLGDPNRITAEGDTALHIACIMDQCDVMQYLVTERNCNPNIKNHGKKMPVELTLNAEMTQFLIKNGAVISSELVLGWLKLEDGDQKLRLVEGLVDVDRIHKTSDGDTAIHLACKCGSSHILHYLLDVYKCNANIENSNGMTPIQMTRNTDIDTIEILVMYNAETNADVTFTLICEASGNPKCIDILKNSLRKTTWSPEDRTGCSGNTALHLACEQSILAIVRILLSEAGCNPNVENYVKQMPFQLCSDPEIMQELVEYGAVLHSHNISHLLQGDIDPDKVITVFETALEKENWNPLEPLSNGDTVLHVACKSSKYELARYLLSEVKCNPNVKDSEGCTPIKYAEEIGIVKELVRFKSVTSSREVFMLISSTTKGQEEETVELLRILFEHTTWNPDDTTSEGDTALHLACNVNSAPVVHCLLSEANCDPNVKNGCKKIPFETTYDLHLRQELICYGTRTDAMYRSYHKVLGTSEPLKPPVKVFVVGNPFAGKSTLIAALQNELSFVSRLLPSKKVGSVPSKTVGVIPYDFESKIFGPVTLYDFAGQREYYSSHAALLQIAVQSSAPIFLLVVNLCDSDADIQLSIFYWFSFLENQCTIIDHKPQVIIIGSHADLVESTEQRDKHRIARICSSYQFVNLNYVGYVPMDCQYSKSDGMTKLQSHLSKCCDLIRIKENITFNAHCFYVFLSKMKFTVGTLGSVLEHIKNAIDDVAQFLPLTLGAVYKICVELNERGHLLFLKNPNKAENSWIIFNKTAILSDVVGTIFAPEGFSGHQVLASNTGVVPLSKIKAYFPQYDSDVLIGFLTHLEFCHEISNQELVHLICEQYSPEPNERYYLFPGLIAKDTPYSIDMDDVDCGWILQCKNLHQFFDTRFLQVLLLRLAFSFAVVNASEQEVPVLQRKCLIWKNGILWSSGFTVAPLVEMSSDNKAVTVLMQHLNHSLLRGINLRTEIIQKIFQCAKENCPNIEFCESVITSCKAIQYPLRHPSSEMLVSIQDVARACVKSNVRSLSAIDELLVFEPYIYLGTKIIELLVNEQTANEVISDRFLDSLTHRVIQSGKEGLFLEIFGHTFPSVPVILVEQVLRKWKASCEGTYLCLRRKLEQYSIFAGRNILVCFCNSFACTASHLYT